MVTQGSMSTKQAAQYLGISEKAIYHWVRKLGLPRRRVGFKIVYLPSELDAWLKTQATEQAFRRSQQGLVPFTKKTRDKDSARRKQKRGGRPVLPPVQSAHVEDGT